MLFRSEFARLVMAQIKISRKDYSNALRELLQLEKTSPIKNPRDDWVAIANQLGYVYRMLGNLDEAEKRQLKVLAWARKNKQFEVTAAACDELAEIAIARSNKKLAREYLDQTLRCFISLELTPMIEATQRRIDELELD